MATWKVLKFKRPDGTRPVDSFLSSAQVSKVDRRKVDSRVRMIESVEQLQTDWVVNYQTTNLQRLKPNCQIRFLCHRDAEGKRIILFNGMLKKGKHLPDDKILEAEQMFSEFNQGLGHVENY
jgi:hypothetical protein